VRYDPPGSQRNCPPPGRLRNRRSEVRILSGAYGEGSSRGGEVVRPFRRLQRARLISRRARPRIKRASACRSMQWDARRPGCVGRIQVASERTPRFAVRWRWTMRSLEQFDGATWRRSCRGGLGRSRRGPRDGGGVARVHRSIWREAPPRCSRAGARAPSTSTYRFEPDDDVLLRALPELKERLDVNIELVSPGDFIPAVPGWRDRSPFVCRVDTIDVHHLDPYSQALAKVAGVRARHRRRRSHAEHGLGRAGRRAGPVSPDRGRAVPVPGNRSRIDGLGR
jgi:hypothetical protein